MGADIVMHSGTKYLDGQGRVMAGALCASHDMVNRTFLPVMKNSGMVLSPFNAWVVLKGLETLDLRMRAQSALAQELASSATFALALAKKMFQGMFVPTLEQQLEQENLYQSTAKLTEDHLEGVDAFKNKRAAVFKGR